MSVSCVLTLLLVLLLCVNWSYGDDDSDPATTTEAPVGETGSWLQNYTHVVVIITVLGGIVVVLAVLVAVIVFVRVIRRRKGARDRLDEMEKLLPQKRVIQEKTEERKKEENIERDNSFLAAEYVLRKTGRYQMKSGDKDGDPQLCDMGSRMQKYWFRVVPTEGEQPPPELVLSIAPIPRECKLLEQDGTMKKRIEQGLNDLMRALRHPFLQPVLFIHYLPDRKQVIIVQPFNTKGSLKDLIYNVSPNSDWADKYPAEKTSRSKASGLSRKEVALYGRQILEAMLFLQEKLSLKGHRFVIGHVQSGNIFVQDGVCRLGGYENTLLGYRSRLYRMCEHHLQHMDVIMFGHVIFEMSCGYELSTLTPTEEDYSSVRDGSVKEVLQFIFTEGFSNTLNNINQHVFFKAREVPQLNEYNPKEVKLTKIMKTVREKFYS